jgi:DNA polymerase-3 subunit gamma/tau
VFRALDRVADSGHDPRRFLTDLLERFRDLVIVRAVPDAASSGLIEVPDDQAARMAGQAARFGPADLVRLADVVDEGITAMKGATPTRLQLELVCARLLLPGADGSVAGVQARLDRLERRLALDEAVPPSRPQPEGGTAAAPTGHAETPTPSSAQPGRVASPAGDGVIDAVPAEPAEPTTGDRGDLAPAPAEVAPASTSGAGAASGVADVRRLWPEVLVRLREIKRTPWSLLSQESTVVDVADGVLTLAFRQPSLRDTFARRSDFQDNLRQAITDVLGVDLKLEAIVDPSADAGRRSEPAVTPPRASQGAAPAAEAAPSSTVQPAGGASPSEAGASPASASDPSPSAPGRPAGERRVGSRPAGNDSDSGGDAHPDDADHADSGLSERQLLERTLGARVIEEIDHT